MCYLIYSILNAEIKIAPQKINLMILKLKDIASIRVGYHTRGKIEPDPKGKFPILQIKNLKEDHTFNPDDLIMIDPGRNVNDFIIKKKDILFLSRGWRNFAFMVDTTAHNVIAAYYFYIVRIENQSILPEYLTWYINQAPARNYIKTMARQGSAIPIVPKSAIENLPVEIPSLDIQRKIMELDSLYLRERQILEQISKAREKLIRAVCIQAVRKYERSIIRREKNAKRGK